MQKFLFIKPAYVENEAEKYDIAHDILSLEQTLIKIYKDISIDICSVTLDNEWLISGRKIDIKNILKKYNRKFVFVHNVDKVFSLIKDNLKHFSDKNTFLYKQEDNLFHHAKKLEEFININNTENYKIRFPHQKHINIKAYNDDAITTDQIVGEYMRQLFLPIHTLPTNFSKHKAHKETNLSYNAQEFIENLDKLRHIYDELTFREYIDGNHIYIAVIPDYKDQDYYLGLPLILKKVNDIEMFDIANISFIEKEGVRNLVTNISKICFNNQAVVYRLSVHKKRGIFVEHTSSLLTYLLHYPDFVFETVGSLGLDIEDFVDRIFV